MRYALFFLLALSTRAQKRIPIKVVVVAMFERGADTGDQAGEYPALEAAWRVGHVVVTKIVQNWTNYRDAKW